MRITITNYPRVINLLRADYAPFGCSFFPTILARMENSAKHGQPESARQAVANLAKCIRRHNYNSRLNRRLRKARNRMQ